MATVPDNCACVPAMLRPPDTCADDFGDRHPRRLEKAVPAGRLDGLCFCPDGPVPGAVGRLPAACLLILAPDGPLTLSNCQSCIVASMTSRRTGGSFPTWDQSL